MTRMPDAVESEVAALDVVAATSPAALQVPRCAAKAPRHPTTHAIRFVCPWGYYASKNVSLPTRRTFATAC